MATPDHPHVDDLAAFLPKSHLRLLARRRSLPPGATQERWRTAVLFIDVSGFTAGVTEAFGHLGALGAEQLSQLIYAYFGRITDTIARFGGDVLFYAGDSVLAIWPDTSPGDLPAATWRAAHCAQAIQGAVTSELLAPEHRRLGLRASVGAGLLTLMELGGVQDRWYLLASGPPLLQATQANGVAKKGEVVLSPEAWALIQEHGRAATLHDGMVRLEHLTDPPPGEPFDIPGLDAIASLLPHCVSRSVVDRVAAGQSHWLAEFRMVSIVFVHLFGDTARLTVADTLQPAVRDALAVLHEFGGNVYQLLADDKGASLVAAFGLPPDAHENDPYRASQAALAMHAAVSHAGLRPSIGVATGQVYCGVCGSDTRRQYSLVGPTVSFGARLMQAAEGGILCDADTARAAHARGGGEFEAAGTIQPKGRPRPVEVFRPLRRSHAVSASRPTNVPDTLVGRATERGVCLSALEVVQHTHRGGLLIIEGEPGIGKSALLADVVAAARERGIRVLRGAGDEIEHGTAFHAWRSILADILGLDDPTSPQVSQVEQRLGERPEWLLRAPLLNAVVPLGIPETRLTEGVHGEPRAESTRRLLIELLEDSASRTPTVVAMEDIHWLDESSMALLVAAAEQIGSLLLLATSRPPTKTQAGAGPLLATAGVRRLPLDALSAVESRRLVCQHLQVESIPDSVARLILAKAAGNPLYSQELAYALRDFRVIEIADGQCRVAGAGIDPARALEQALPGHTLPGTVQGIITSRLDHLHPAEQLAAKVASVIGLAFSFATLRAVYPVVIDEAVLLRSLDELERRQLIRSDPEAAQTWSFQHAVTRDVVYGTLLFGQRQVLHQAVAEHYEREVGERRPQYFLTLAHHWRAAGNRAKAATYLTEAGAQSVEQFSNADAVTFLTEAVALEEGIDRPGESKAAHSARLARQFLLLGKAHLGLSEYVDVRRFLERGVALLGLRVPPSGWRLGWGVGVEILRQVRNRIWSARYLGNRHADRDRLRAAAVAYEGLAETYYYTGAEAHTFYACLRTLNLAEAGGPSTELARGYATMGTILSLVPARGLAERYGRRALATTQAVGQLAAQPYVCVIVGIARMGSGDFPQAVPLFEEASRTGAELGDRRRWSDAVGHIGMAGLLQGDARSAQARFQEMYREAVRAHDLRYQAEALRSRAHAELTLADFEGARGTLSALQAVLAAGLPSEVESTERHLAALLGLWHARRGELEEAEGHVRRAAKLIAASRPTDELYHGFLGAAATLEAGFAIQEARADDRLLDPLRSVVRCLSGRARLFPVARPAYLRHRGNLAWISGRRRHATRDWRDSSRLATALAMPLEAALAEFEAGRHLSPADSGRAELLTRAAETLLALGADHHYARAQAALHSS